MAFKTRRAALATVLFVVAFALAVFGGRAQAAQTTLTVSPLTIGFGGTVNGTISGFAANAAVTVNGRVYTSDNSGVVSLGGAQLLTTSAGLHLAFADSSGTPQTVDVSLTNSADGMALSLSAVAGLLLGQTVTTSGTQVTVGTADTTTTTQTTTTTSSGGGGSGGGGSGGGGSGGGGGGGTTIAVGSVAAPNHLVIDKVTFSKRVLRTRAPFAVDVTVRDTAGKLVVGAKVSVVSVPSTRTKPVAGRTTSSTGKAHFVVIPTRRLPLVRDGRLNLYVRGWSPNATQSSITAKRLVSIRVAR